MRPLVINWPLSSVSGYGIYGLQILLHYLRRGGEEFALPHFPIKPLDLPDDMERDRAMIESATRAAVYLQENPHEIAGFDGPVLSGVGNPYSTFPDQLRVKGRPNIGCAAIEEPVCPPDWLPFLKFYDRFIAASTWSGEILKAAGLTSPIHVCRLGIDPTHFHIAPTPSLAPGRFVIFSGGKFEFRKGQDIVVAAFRRFREKYPDALLVTSWQNPSAVDAAPFAAAGHCTTTPEMETTQPLKLGIATWLKTLGLPEGSFIDLGWQHNSRMASIMRGCDVAIFPNRCEGGTNMVAKETLACGVPTYVSANTGQKDLIDLVGCPAFQKQMPVKTNLPGILCTEGWGESDVDEVVSVLEQVYANPAGARQKAEAASEIMKGWSWAHQNEIMLNAVYGADWNPV